MSNFELPKDICPLCDLTKTLSFESKLYARSRTYKCLNCGYYSISLKAYKLSPLNSNSTLRARVSYIVRHNSSEDKPIFILQENLKNILKLAELPAISMQIDNLLKWFGETSNYSLDTVDGNTKHLIALIGCKNQQQVINVLDQLWSDNLIDLEVPTTGPLRERATFDLFSAHLTKTGIDKIELLSSITFPSPITLESALHKGESSSVEFKGSFKLDINRLLLSEDNKKENHNSLALEGVLKSIVAFLNSSGGNIFIGILEKSKFTSEKISLLKFIEHKDYYLIGIEPELNNPDKYELNIRELISSHISKDTAGLIDISFPIYMDLTYCHIVIHKPNHKWYYLDGKFFVRDGNRSIELVGEAMDDYKKRNKRG